MRILRSSMAAKNSTPLLTSACPTPHSLNSVLAYDSISSPPSDGIVTTAISCDVSCSNCKSISSKVASALGERISAKSFTYPDGVPGDVYAKPIAGSRDARANKATKPLRNILKFKLNRRSRLGVLHRREKLMRIESKQRRHDV